MRSIQSCARCSGGMCRRETVERETRNATLTESADARGSRVKMSLSSIRMPCSLQIGCFTFGSQTASIASPMRCHHPGVPGIANLPDDPMATVRKL